MDRGNSVHPPWPQAWQTISGHCPNGLPFLVFNVSRPPGVLCALLFSPFDGWGQTIAPITGSEESQAKPTGATPIDYGMPERLGRQIAPTSGAPWHSPDLHGYTSLLKSAEPSPINQQKRYS